MAKMEKDDLPSWCDQQLIEELMDKIEEIQDEDEYQEECECEESDEMPMVMEIKLSMN